MKIIDYLVVGSGCSGAMAAQTLVEAGAQVTMLDVGEQAANKYEKLIPDSNFLSIRKTHAEQYKYFIGHNADGIEWTDIGKGAQITPPRKHMLRLTESLIPLISTTFSSVESLGYGGLGIAWGLQCWEYSDDDMEQAGLARLPMRAAYDVVSQRIGISAVADTAARYTMHRLKTYQPPLRMDRNHHYLHRKYKSRQAHFEKAGFHMGRTPLALLSKDLNGRKKYAYRDMDYYSDKDHSAWRPWMTVNRLRRRKNFTYINRQLVTSFSEKAAYTEVVSYDVDSGATNTWRCRKLILATGALGSARLVLRSFNDYKTRLPLLCNTYNYIPCLQPAMIGKAAEPKKLGVAQLSLFLDETGTRADNSVASFYGYQSLMLLRTIRQLPFDFMGSRELLRYLVTGLVIMGVHHPDTASKQKYVQLVKSKTITNDALAATYKLSEAELAEQRRREKKLAKAVRRMRTYPIKRIDPGNGTSIHYAGTLPFSDTDKPFTLARSGRLHGTKHVYVADSSGFNYLPAPGLTFSLMANAHLVAKGVLENAN